MLANARLNIRLYIRGQAINILSSKDLWSAAAWLPPSKLCLKRLTAQRGAVPDLDTLLQRGRWQAEGWNTQRIADTIARSQGDYFAQA
jgi:hypothetical protein